MKKENEMKKKGKSIRKEEEENTQTKCSHSFVLIVFHVFSLRLDETSTYVSDYNNQNSKDKLIVSTESKAQPSRIVSPYESTPAIIIILKDFVLGFSGRKRVWMIPG